MPLVRIDLVAGESDHKGKQIGELVHQAMVDVLGVPKDDKFQIITAHPADQLNITPSYLGIAHGPSAVIIQITLNHGRSTEKKSAFYRRVADDLHLHLSLPREDVIISLVEVAKENWSFGNGDAPYA